MDKDLMAQYGEACLNFEIWSNKVNELKRLIAAELNKPKEVAAVVEPKE